MTPVQKPEESRTALSEVHIQLPTSWHEALREASREMGMSLSALTRLLYRQFLRNRYTDEEREGLEGRQSETHTGGTP